MGNLGRFTVSSGHPTTLPGRCATCGTTGDTDYIHIGLHIQFYGEVLICVTCFRGGAIEHCGVVPVHNMETVKADLDIKTSLLQSSIDKIGELEVALANFESMRTYFGSVGTVAVANELEQSTAETDSGAVEDSSGEPKQPESGSSESTSESGSPDVRSDDSLDELSDLIGSI